MEKSQRDEYREQRFLENFIEFGSLHRARVAYECLQRFRRIRRENQATRASLALEILQTYLNAFEDVGIWLIVVPKWLAGKGGLLELLSSRIKRDERQPRMRPKYSTLEQLAFYGQYSTPDALARRLRLPYHEREFDTANIAADRREALRLELKELSRLFNVFFWEAERVTPCLDAPGATPRRGRTGDIQCDLAPWKVLNRIKHGLLVTLSKPENRGAGVCVHTNPEDFEEYWEIPVRYYSLTKLVALTFVGCLFLGRLLSLVYQPRYHAVPAVSWLEASIRVNLKRLDPYQIERVLRASRVPRRYDLLAAVSHQERVVEPYLFGELSANWWRGHPE